MSTDDTNAYKMHVRGGVLTIMPTNCPPSRCDRPNAALAKLRAGEVANVRADDAAAVRTLVTGKTVRGEPTME